MKKIFFAIVLFSLILIININCYARGSVTVRYVGSISMGYYEVIMNYNNDNDYQMGQLYAKALLSQDADLETRFARYFKDSLSAGDYNEMMTRVQRIKNQIPQEYRDFINGLASQLNGGTDNNREDDVLSVDEVFYFSLLSEIHRLNQCSVVAVYGEASDTGKPIIGRLVDWSGKLQGVVYYINKGNKKTINIGTTLLSQSVSTGLNHHGLFAAVLDAPTGQPFPDLASDTYYSYHFDLRYALENYRTIDDIAYYLSQKKYVFNHLILLGDSKTVKVLENDLEGSRALRDSDSNLNSDITWEFPNAIGAVNAFLLENNYDNFSFNPFNTYRWQSIKDQLSSYLSPDNKISVNEMKSITTYYGNDIDKITDGGIMNFLTQQIVIFDSKNHELHVFFRNNRSIGTENTETSFDVDNPEFLIIPLKSIKSKSYK